MNCTDCHRPLRPRGVKAADAPGTRKAEPGPRCPPCYGAAPKQGKARATECTDCERPLRPANTPLAEQPGTVVHTGHGRCRTCNRHRAGVAKYRRGTRPTNCKDCQVPLRPNHANPANYPGATRHAGKGLCAACRSKAGTAAKPHKPKVTPAPVVKAAPPAPKLRPVPTPESEPVITDPGLLRMIAARQARAERARRQELARALITRRAA